MRARILVGGSINTDLVVRVATAPEAGETVTGSDFGVFGGGKGANQAVAAARSGADVAMLGGVGVDDFGNGRLADLANDQIHTATVARLAERPSGVALITVEDSGQNRIAYVPGATWGVTSEQALEAVHSWQPSTLLTTLELPHDAIGAAYAEARAAGITILCNATPEPALGRALAFSADVLIVNETEAVDLLDRPEAQNDWAMIGRELLACGPRIVVITLGSQGALVLTGDSEQMIAAPAVPVVDTTGAGDAFCGAFATELASGADPLAAARFGVYAGSLAVTKAGAQPSMPHRDDVLALMQE